MSMLGRIFSRILGRPAEAAEAAEASKAGAAAPAATGGAAAPASAAPAAAAMNQVDLEKVMNERAAAAGQKLNWRTSIVDLMKLLDLDSGLAARKELATELGYTGDTSDSATMNVWLHKQVMRKVAENGGIVPADLKD
ncbi:DUF3597 domain-containing protein [Neoroseomonas soli]|uniref:DUF3597 domain-containing protein n=1 Tax=Neoroseomonas soli TaxID=1081025 RepID=A0A9X9WRY7_9PROT|nr:DUF3597 domain-containing protein [Neoroseomonas soli]MBR0669916.1 DUF3597 domain-containing protein [Neoroseomonas soli]